LIAAWHSGSFVCFAMQLNTHFYKEVFVPPTSIRGDLRNYGHASQIPLYCLMDVIMHVCCDLTFTLGHFLIPWGTQQAFSLQMIQF